ncbi:hypothetical protein SNQ34_000287 [Cronobacter sakazakii]|nr:hypothetical protein [Cronobacter sakazakii]
MSEMSKERVEALASSILECHDVKPSEVKALAALALMALRERAETVGVPDLHKVVYHFRDLNEGFPVERFKADYVIAWMLANYPPAPVVPDDVLAALRNVAKIRLDFNDFDGDRRGMADCLGEAERAV